jgi:hypothetical protein
MNIAGFVEDQNEQSDFLGMKRPHIQLRGVALAAKFGTRQLRTKKNSYQAVAWDELGNVTILDKQGNVRLLHPSEYEG